MFHRYATSADPGILRIAQGSSKRDHSLPDLGPIFFFSKLKIAIEGSKLR